MSEVPTRLLRDTLRDAAAADPSAACLDADTLAAWSDGTLNRRERAAAESHASNCARCQALLAVMVKTAPPAPERPWWHRPAFGWLVPIAVGAIAVVMWINVPASWSKRFQTAPASPPSSATSPTPADRVASTDTQGRVDQPALPPALMARQPAATADQRRAEPLRPRQLEQRGSTPAQSGQQADLPKARREAGAAAPAVPSVPRADPAEQVAATAQANAIAPLAGTPLLQPPALGTLDAVGASAREPALAKTAAGSAPILSPDPRVRWRVVAAGSVDRSGDGGTTWQTQSTGVPVMLTAGTAPSPAICWIVGPAGTVVLSIDGRPWQRVAIPEAIDLASVRASDAANATVTATDGRTFTTTDGGKTWRP